MDGNFPVLYSSFESQNIRIEEYLYHACSSTDDKITLYPLLGIPTPIREGKEVEEYSA